MQSDHENMLDELFADETDSLTAWEVEFMDSLHRSRDRDLSDKQVAVLERIWNKLFG